MSRRTVGEGNAGATGHCGPSASSGATVSHGAGAGVAGSSGVGHDGHVGASWVGVGCGQVGCGDDIVPGGLGGDRRDRLGLGLGLRRSRLGLGLGGDGGRDARARGRRQRRQRRASTAPRRRVGRRGTGREPGEGGGGEPVIRLLARRSARRRGSARLRVRPRPRPARRAPRRRWRRRWSRLDLDDRLRLRLDGRRGRERQIVVDDDGAPRAIAGDVRLDGPTASSAAMLRLVRGDRVLEALARGHADDRAVRHPRRPRLSGSSSASTPARASANAARSSSVSAIAAAPATAAAAAVAASRSNSSSSSTASTVASVSASSRPSARERRAADRSSSGQASTGSMPFVSDGARERVFERGWRRRRRRTPAPPCPGSGAHVRQRPSAVFQQSPHVYWRQVRQKLKVWWNASSWCAIGGELFLAAGLGHRLGEGRVVREDEVLHPLAERAHLAEPRSPRRRRLEGVAGAAPFAERLGEDFRHSVAPERSQIEMPGTPPAEQGQSIASAQAASAAPWYRRTIAVRPGNGADRDPLVRWRAPWPCSPTSNASSNGSSSAPPRACSAPTSSRCSSSGAWSARWSAPDRGGRSDGRPGALSRPRCSPTTCASVGGPGRRGRGARGPARRRGADVRPGPRLPPARPPRRLARRRSVARARAGRGRRRGGVRPAAARPSQPSSARRRRTPPVSRPPRPPRPRAAPRSQPAPIPQTWTPNPIVDAIEPDRQVREPGARADPRGGVPGRPRRRHADPRLPPPGADRHPRRPPRLVARRHRAHDRGRRDAARRSAGRATTASSSPTPGSRASTAGSRPAAGRSSTPTSAARTARASTGSGSTRSRSAWATALLLGDTVLVVESLPGLTAWTASS